MSKAHWALFVDNTSRKDLLVDAILEQKAPAGFEALNGLKGSLFSKRVLERFIDKEDRHGTRLINSDRDQTLKSMSSGEQKKALLKHLLGTKPDFLILDNPFDNLDIGSQEKLRHQLKEVSEEISIVQLVSRKTDVLPFIDTFARLEGSHIRFYKNKSEALSSSNGQGLMGEVPQAPYRYEIEDDVLIRLNDVCVKYGEKPILQNIDWTIKKGEFWELRGNNGSGKTTILSMITGDNPKGYGQDLHIFGHKKGSGESVWEIKKLIGYFTPSITDKFTGYHSVEHMVISGLTDSIGLYVRPTEIQLRLAQEWLRLIGLWDVKDELFHDLTMGQKRLVMCARAMIKHPPLLILDEPTAGLDDASAALFVTLVNKFAKESDTTTIFVSHRKEPGLDPDFVYQLEMDTDGSKGRVL
ncbi:ATP-binding cassette domain-containing protein [Pseudozobellia thermophila]|uniref:Molybdate transport system ATP-binding protein n=1 Tax=Pseudozobellia thermophila TaxID=192903 RepID=A0A1M6HGQ5_9FLAO|nr:ATP-binding cassette domain-containing protein [Pseudozobellia thermophila]SHJ21357.1 molybdate transport system ATP-binding protein [Pseudozobellia thermophila]